ncbi:transmembrane protein 223-like, partial [Actinia tenebrosa]|uniref:Transmembrane protein 223-like n=1 Tax=Actinia tenebrosa TaxID=6105 RepID=A0A6P8J8A8_ACTTE
MLKFLSRCAITGSALSAIKKKIIQHTTRLYQTRTTVVKDATIFYHDRRKFFRLVGIASSSQFVFWIYLAHFQYTTRPQLLAGLAEKEKTKEIDSFKSESKAWKIVAYIEKSPVFLSVFAVSVGMFLSATGWIYCLRNINRIVLLSGGRTVRFVTHTPLGGTRSFSTLVDHVSSLGSRMGKNNFVTEQQLGGGANCRHCQKSQVEKHQPSPGFWRSVIRPTGGLA